MSPSDSQVGVLPHALLIQALGCLERGAAQSSPQRLQGSTAGAEVLTGTYDLPCTYLSFGSSVFERMLAG